MHHFWQVLTKIHDILQSAEMEASMPFTSSERFEMARTRLESLIKVMEDYIDTDDETFLHKCVSCLRKLSNSSSTCTNLPVNIPTMLDMSGQVGRPRVLISMFLRAT